MNIEDSFDKFKTKMIMDDRMGTVFMAGVGSERTRIFEKLRQMDLGDIDIEKLIRSLVR